MALASGVDWCGMCGGDKRSFGKRDDVGGFRIGPCSRYHRENNSKRRNPASLVTARDRLAIMGAEVLPGGVQSIFN